MINKYISTENEIFKEYLNKRIIKNFDQKYSAVIKNVNRDLNQSKKTLNILGKNFKLNFKFEDLKKFKKFKSIVILGMGGSILGSEAIYYFLKDRIKKRVYFIDNIDSENILQLKKKLNYKKTLFIIISKSGNTIETFSNFLSFNVIKKNSKNIIIISEKKNSLLFALSKKMNLFYIEHKDYIGGRFSVLSEVGMVPAYLMGLKIPNLRQNLKRYLEKKEKLFLKDSTIKLANLLYEKKINNLVFINYLPKLEKFLYWCQQLIAESLGKKGKGFLPVISNAPKDHHSLLQLYLDGPKDKLFYIFYHEEKPDLKINTKKFVTNINYLHNKSLNKVKKAQKNALIQSLKKNRIPFREFELKKITEETLAELFSYFILETVIIGNLLNLNPYNQPAVEQVKINTKKLLD